MDDGNFIHLIPYVISVIAMLLLLIIPLISSIGLRLTYASCKKKHNKLDLTGRDVAQKILEENGLTGGYIVETHGLR